jgi:hypothetical protein
VFEPNYVILTTHSFYIFPMWDSIFLHTHTCILNNFLLLCESITTLSHSPSNRSFFFFFKINLMGHLQDYLWAMWGTLSAPHTFFLSYPMDCRLYSCHKHFCSLLHEPFSMLTTCTIFIHTPGTFIEAHAMNLHSKDDHPCSPLAFFCPYNEDLVRACVTPLVREIDIFESIFSEPII